jgi:hypothetical protein
MPRCAPVTRTKLSPTTPPTVCCCRRYRTSRARTRAEIRDYFVKFLKSGPQGMIDNRIIKIGCNVAQDVGTYTFKFADCKTVRALHIRV